MWSATATSDIGSNPLFIGSYTLTKLTQISSSRFLADNKNFLVCFAADVNKPFTASGNMKNSHVDVVVELSSDSGSQPRGLIDFFVVVVVYIWITDQPPTLKPARASICLTPNRSTFTMKWRKIGELTSEFELIYQRNVSPVSTSFLASPQKARGSFRPDAHDTSDSSSSTPNMLN